MTGSSSPPFVLASPCPGPDVCHGNGERGVRKGDWDQGKNIFLQTICTDEVAQAIMDYLYDHYYEDYAIIAYATEVDIHRSSKF